MSEQDSAVLEGELKGKEEEEGGEVGKEMKGNNVEEKGKGIGSLGGSLECY